ncbi:solute symporter family protein [Kyrpidia spormannii]|uniref:Acetate Na+-dependent symporter subunit involved in volatile signal for biofilm formation n=1 Tax=Kyrpidia spormannii TaxID=2055160 RepID=A0A6F9EC85_9BACL|nr:sodium/solute symporter [Kyrpidia spormannii]CAB3394481.1 acetate Na+-dependent symporter subunit involved in volatile signal for biofilm formation [Kyrpidia spormannii]
MNQAAFLFVVFVLATLGITYWAARRTRTTAEYYTAGRSLKGWQNGLAIAGDYMSAGSFLGITGMIALAGFDGFLYSVGVMAAFIVVLFVVAEPIRNTGKYTMADVLAYRLNPVPVRSAAAISTLALCCCYMIAQMVGAGAVIHLLFGFSPSLAIVLVGVLMILYVVFGGMLATTWVQIVKALLLIGGSLVLTMGVLFTFHFSIAELFHRVTSTYGIHFLESGQKFTNPWDQVSLGLELVLGTAGMPHILMRFYTVPSAREARVSAVWSTVVISLFYIMSILIGLGAAVLVGKKSILSADPGGNMAAPLLAASVGGDLLLAFIAAVTFGTILAVVAGLTLAASSAFSHDFYTNILRKGTATEDEQVRVARYTALVVGIIGVVLGILCKDLNVAFMTALASAMAASANLPVIVFSLFWKRFNAAGAVIGIVVGLVSSVGLVLISPVTMGKQAIFPLLNPGIVSIPLGFLGAWLGALVTARDLAGEKRFTELFVRAQTGTGAE